MKKLIPLALAALTACSPKNQTTEPQEIDYTVDRFADIEVLRYTVPGFEELSLQQKQLIYHLTEAAIAGRDIIWDQNCAYNLPIRDLLEAVYVNYSGDKSSADYKAFETYLKQVEFANGIHHHYSMDKFTPAFSREFLAEEAAKLPTEQQPSNLDELLTVIFDPTVLAKRVNQADGVDLIATSACNLYGGGVTQKEVEDYYAAIKDTTDTTPISYGLNARVVKTPDGTVTEEIYKIDGVYGPQIAKIVEHLTKAAEFAENDTQRDVIGKLIEYYTTGSLSTFDDYSIAWVNDTDSRVDFINGFIESYGDPLGMTGSYESIVNFKDLDASHRTEVVAKNAQWFEDNSPVAPEFRKPEVKGITAKV
ncbi:MAG: dipeptidyl peptidase 3, partial [Muribaculaceae bacterium]|nr:dipeptidyl peptidase 3 [Muribaculaceae bacterium]